GDATVHGSRARIHRAVDQADQDIAGAVHREPTRNRDRLEGEMRVDRLVQHRTNEDGTIGWIRIVVLEDVDIEQVTQRHKGIAAEEDLYRVQRDRVFGGFGREPVQPEELARRLRATTYPGETGNQPVNL